jgi:hypothetical protein
MFCEQRTQSQFYLNLRNKVKRENDFLEHRCTWGRGSRGGVTYPHPLPPIQKIFQKACIWKNAIVCKRVVHPWNFGKNLSYPHPLNFQPVYPIPECTQLSFWVVMLFCLIRLILWNEKNECNYVFKIECFYDIYDLNF